MGVDLQEAIDTSTEPTTSSEEPIFTHIVRTERGESAEAKVLASMVEGVPVVALCGYTWVPSRDPKKYPACPKCVEVYGFDRQFA